MKSVELFAGAGGLALATANAGFDHVAMLEWDRNACNTIRRNLAAPLQRIPVLRIVGQPPIGTGTNNNRFDS